MHEYETKLNEQNTEILRLNQLIVDKNSLIH